MRISDWIAGWSPAIRVARREARRAKGRSALVIALIALPVTGLSFAAVSYDSARLTPEQQLTREIGSAAAELRWVADGPITQTPDGHGAAYPGNVTGQEMITESQLRAVLPGARPVPVRRSDLALRTATGVGTLPVEGLDLTDPIHRGRIEILRGRGPADPTEIAVTRQAAARLSVTIGDPVEAADGSDRWQVVGIVEHLERYRESVVLHPSLVAAEPGRWLLASAEPISWEQVKQLNQHGLLVRSRAVVLDPPPASEVDMPPFDPGRSAQAEAFQLGLIVAGLALVEVVLLAGPAFAIGARRRQRDLALVAVSGGAPAHLRRVVLADGVVLGALAAAVGVVIGAAAGLASLPLISEYVLQRPMGGVRLWPPVLLGLVGLAVLIGMLAALVPAVLAARQEVIGALAGRRGVTRISRRWPVLGGIVAVTGAVLAGAGAWRIDAGLVVAGLVLGQLGLVLATPALLGLVARLGRFLPLSPRIALRDTARNRAAAAPAVSAVMAAVAGALTIGIYGASDAARAGGDYAPSLPAGYAAVNYDAFDEETGVSGLAVDQQQAVVEALLALPATVEVRELPSVACPEDSDETECHGVVRRPPENECFAWDIEAQRQLTAEERRAARADPRCKMLGYTLGGIYRVVVDDGRLLTTLTDPDEADLAAATATLAAGGVVVGNPLLVADGQATVEFYIGDSPRPLRLTAPAYALTSASANPYLEVISPELVRRAGLAVGNAAAVAVTDAVPTRADQDALDAQLRAVHANLGSYVERGDAFYREFPVLVLAVAAGVIMLGAAGIATGLASADRRTDLATLGAVGASPRLRRLLSLSQSGVISGLGALLGTLGGLGGAVAVLFALNQRSRQAWPEQEIYPLTVPWQLLVTVLVIVPLVAMLGAAVFSRSRLPIERRTT